MSDKAWYLVYSKPQQEMVALRNLEQQAYHAYLPLLSEKKRVRGVHKTVSCPLFSRYLFIELDAQFDNWLPVRSTRGVSGLVRFGQQAARVPTDFIQGLQHQAERLSELLIQAAKFSEGDTVMLMDGPFKGYEAVFQLQKGHERAIVLLDIANRHTQLAVKMDMLEKA